MNNTFISICSELIYDFYKLLDDTFQFENVVVMLRMVMINIQKIFYVLQKYFIRRRG